MYRSICRLAGLILEYINNHRLCSVLISCWCISTLLGWWLYEALLALSVILFAALAMGVAWPWLCIRGVSAQLRFDSCRVSEGQTTWVVVSLVNHLPWPVYCLTVHLGPGNSRGARLTLKQVLAWSHCEFRWEYEPVKRGVHPLGQAQLSSSFPFGIWEARKVISIAQPLIVWPKTFSVKLPDLRGHLDNWLGKPNPYLAGHGGDMLGVRCYRRGEPKKRIHWPQSLRVGQLVICEYEAEARAPILFVLDSAPGNWDGVHTESCREWAIRWTASCAKAWLEMGYAIGLVSVQGLVLPQSGPIIQTRRILDCLAQVPDTSEVFLPQLLARARTLQGAVIVVVTNERSVREFGILKQNRAAYWVIFATQSGEPGKIPQPQRCLWVNNLIRGLSRCDQNGAVLSYVNST